MDEIANRVTRRLIIYWGVGDVEIELDQNGKVIHRSIAAKEKGLSVAIPEGNMAIPIKYNIVPVQLAAGDIVNFSLTM